MGDLAHDVAAISHKRRRQCRTGCGLASVYSLRSTNRLEKTMSWLPTSSARAIASRTCGAFLVLLLAAVAGLTVHAAQRVNINTADATTMASVLDGVGLKKAEAIVDYREANGRFNAPEELAKVKGIGPSTVARNAEKIAISAEQGATTAATDGAEQ